MGLAFGSWSGRRAPRAAARAVALAGAFGACASAATASTVTEFRVRAGSSPVRIAAGPDGNMWFNAREGVGRITPVGVVTAFSAGIQRGSEPWGIAAGPDGNVWFIESGRRHAGRITPSGAVTEFPIAAANEGDLYGIGTGPDGNLWFTFAFASRIGRITPAGVVTKFTTGIETDVLDRIVPGPDGNMWFNQVGGVGRITPAGVVTEFPLDGSGPEALAWGPDGNLWFTVFSDTAIYRMTPTGAVRRFSVGLTPGSSPLGIAAGPDGNMWFAESEDRIGRITPAGKITEFSYGITRGSGPVDIAAGPDGGMWFTETNAARIARITTTAEPGVAILTRRGRVGAGGATSVKLSCAAGTAPCVGAVGLTATIRVRERPAGSKRVRTVTKTVTAGSSGRFEIAAGQRAEIRVRLTAVGRARLARSAAGRLATVLRAASTGGDVRGRFTLSRAG